MRGLVTREYADIHGRACLLIAAPPNWRSAVRTTAFLRAEVAEKVTGLQDRTKEAAVPKIGMSYTTTLQGAELQQLRAALASVNDRLVLVPFWPDMLRGDLGTDWAARVLAGSVCVGWELDPYGGIEITSVEVGAAPVRTWRGTVLAGYISRARVLATDEGCADVSLTFIEDSPWAFRAPPRASAPAAWSADWQPNWSTSPEQDVKLLSDRSALGRGRESVLEGAPEVTLWRQKAMLTLSGVGISEMLAFYAARGGALAAFDMPSAVRPGAELPNAPHGFDANTGRVRFADKELRFQWETPDLADVQIEIEQQLEDPARPQESAAFAYLYKFSYEGQQATLTDWESPLSDGAILWQPSRVEHGRLRQSLKPQNEECEITVYLDDVPLIAPLIRLEAESPVGVEIYDMELPAGPPQMIFSGAVLRTRAQGKKVRLTAAALGGALKRKIPRFQWSTTCNFAVYSPACARRRPNEMAKSAWMYTGTIAYQWGAVAPRVVLQNYTAPDGKPSALLDLVRYFAGGWLEVLWGTPDRQVREITWSGVHTNDGDPDRLFLAMARVLRGIAVDEPVRFWPGCDGLHATCMEKFGNSDAFGGFPHQPAWIKQAAVSPPSGGKG